MDIIGQRKHFFIVSAALVILSVVFIAIGGLKFGIDFLGGSLQELAFREHVEKSRIEDVYRRQGIANLHVQESDGNGYLLRYENIDEEKHQRLKDAIGAELGEFEEARFETIGPSIGSELRRSSVIALMLVAVGIILYIAYTFRKVSYPVKSWKYGVAAVIALIHDILIVTGFFAVLGRFFGIEIDLLFVTALLTILGFSVNDTIVVFDRIRENLQKKREAETFEGLVNASANQTMTRSLSTSMTTLIVLVAILLFGGESIRWFIVALSAGVIIGTYSSIFVASALLVELEHFQRQRG